MRNYILTICLIFVTICSYGQGGRQIFGCVYGERKTPLQGAHISTTDGELLCVTDVRGQYNMTTEKYITEIVVSYDGYQSCVVKLDGSFQTVRLRILSKNDDPQGSQNVNINKIGAQETTKFRKYDAKLGYQQHLSLGSWLTTSFGDAPYSAIRMYYTGGMRFNDYLFAGIGAGVDIGLSNAKKAVIECNQDEMIYGCALPMQRFAIPLFVNAKAYLMRTKVAPYLSLSAGVRLSTPKSASIYGDNEELVETYKYGAVKPFFEFAAGVNYRINEWRSYNFEFGFYSSFIELTETYKGEFTPCGNFFSPGFSLSVGMTF